MYNIYIYTWIICAKLWMYILLHYIVARVLCPSCIAQPGFEMVVMWQPVRNITWDVSSGNWSYGRSSVVFAVEIIKLHSHVPQPWSFNGRMVAANTERGLMLPMISSLSREIKGRAGVAFRTRHNAVSWFLPMRGNSSAGSATTIAILRVIESSMVNDAFWKVGRLW